jgi:serine/threonine protein kinase
MAYTFSAQSAQGLYGQKLSIRNIANSALENIEIEPKNVAFAKPGMEGYGLRAIHRRTNRSDVPAFLKVFRKDIPQRHERSEFLVRLGLARRHEWIFQGVPYAWFNKQKVNGIEIVGHLTKFIGLQYGRPAEDFGVIKDDAQWDTFTRDERRSFAAHLASAICGLERVQVVHGDLSSGNIMIGPGPNGRNVCCLCDFDGFYHAAQPLLPRQFEGEATRPLGSPGYAYPALIEKIKADKNDSDESIVVETDRFALGVLICEMIVWNSSLAKQLGRLQLLDESIIISRRLTNVPDSIRSIFPEGFALLDKALHAGSCDDMPTPDEWLNCLGVQSILPTPFRSPPHVFFFRRKGTARKLHKQAILNNKPSDNFGSVDPELANIVFNRDSANQVTLAIGSKLPGALRRSGRQQSLTAAVKAALPILPGDMLRIGDWEIVFEESIPRS